MNYNPQFETQNQAYVEKNAKYYRTKAREALTGFWWKAILVTLIASLLGGVAVGGASCNFNFNLGGSDVDDPTYEEGVYEEEEGDLILPRFEMMNDAKHIEGIEAIQYFGK